jgi:nucleotidyltransferase/DNA polymerase involved in DNA repair
VVARSNEAKALGIENGDPWFKLSTDAKRTGLIHKSSNYELYGDLSSRVMELLGRYAHVQEIHSIDESFLTLRGTPDQLQRTGAEIKGRRQAHRASRLRWDRTDQDAREVREPGRQAEPAPGRCVLLGFHARRPRRRHHGQGPRHRDLGDRRPDREEAERDGDFHDR